MDLEPIISEIKSMDLENKIEVINNIKKQLHEISPFRNEPVDLILWVKNDEVQANDYNPNSVAPPEMELLRTSIMTDGFTQPIVTFPEDDKITVIDGFHRNRVGKEMQEVKEKIHGYLPITTIRPSQEDKGDRMASTIRHNRARGKHRIDSMSEIVLELKRRNWSDNKIAKNLGMDSDEILRLCQISGLREMFEGEEFSKAWDIEWLDIDEEELENETNLA
ncbi:ParB-like nuclease domain-containing protein [Candidatus Woesearchaeota archaeon]|jgi:ParB-like chromosome segregation protein Spo0J|nr:ParB-like nuclease domain-containing protein [Candidatus Woesearchaeota archaeon]